MVPGRRTSRFWVIRWGVWPLAGEVECRLALVSVSWAPLRTASRLPQWSEPQHPYPVERIGPLSITHHQLLSQKEEKFYHSTKAVEFNKALLIELYMSIQVRALAPAFPAPLPFVGAAARLSTLGLFGRTNHVTHRCKPKSRPPYAIALPLASITCPPQ